MKRPFSPKFVSRIIETRRLNLFAGFGMMIVSLLAQAFAAVLEWGFMVSMFDVFYFLFSGVFILGVFGFVWKYKLDERLARKIVEASQ